MKHYLIFAGRNLLDFDCYVFYQNIFNAPSRRFDVLDVPGRNGSLIVDQKTFENVELSYNCIIAKDFEKNIALLRDFLAQNQGYKRLEDTYNPDEFYNAYLSGGLEVDDADRKKGKFVLNFSRDPRRFLKTGKEATAYTDTATLINHSRMAAKPFLRIYGNGVLMVNGKMITVSGNTLDYVDIDSETMEIYNGTTDLNAKVTLEDYSFPVLDQFENTFAIVSGITSYEIKPRWWRL